MSFEIMLAMGIIFLYSVGTLGIFLGTLSMRRKIKMAANWVTLAGFVLHTMAVLLALGQALLYKSHSDLTIGFYLQLLAWCLLFLYLCAWRFLRLPFLALTASPLALLLYLLSLRLSEAHAALPQKWSVLFMGLHICSLFASIGLLAMAFGAGLLFVFIERKIKTKSPMTGFTSDMPALGAYDRVNQVAVTIGFPLYTLGIMAGFIWMPLLERTVEQPKVLVSLFIWFLYALLFYQRLALGLRGRKTALMAIWIFIISAASLGMDYLFTHHSVLLQP